MLRLYADNLAVVPLSNLWRPLGLTLGLAIGLWIIASLLLRDVRRGALVASTLVAMLFVYQPIAAIMPPFLVYAVYALLAYLAGRQWRRSPTAFFNFTGSVLALMVASQCGYRLYRTQQTVAAIPEEKSPVARNVQGPKPDIFYIILDGYGRSDALKYFMGLDNSSFVQGLKARGFYVAEKGHSNYSQTEQSLSSSLNMDFLDKLLPANLPTDVIRNQFDKLIDQNRVAAILRSHGYRYVAVSTGFDAVTPKSADLRYENNTSWSLFETALLAATPFAQNTSMNDSMFNQRYRRLLGAFKDLESVGPKGPLPRFVLVHILAPHPPFVFLKDGSMREHHTGPYGLWDGDAFMRVGGTPEAYKDGYGQQATYIGNRTLAALDVLLKAQKTPPILIVQGDHGSKVRLDDQSLEKTDVREVFRNLNAYYVPDAIRAQLYPSITPVNSFRIILNKLFGDPLPNLPDKSYYSTWEKPGDFAEVTNKIEAPLK